MCRVLSKKKINPNTKIEKQRSIFIKKKENSSQGSSDSKKMNTDLTIHEEMLYVHTDNDHTYFK